MGNKIDFEYNKNWTDIARDVFDKIISLDPQTNLERDNIGPASKQLLLPAYINGETDFVNDNNGTSLVNAANVKKSLETYLANRNNYRKELRNIANFESVKNFVEYIMLGDESEFAKNFDVLYSASQEKEKESPLDAIYKKYYSDIEREIFDKIIALDPKTTDKGIGMIAKNFLLPKYKKGEDFLDKAELVADAISRFYEESDNYPADKRNIASYPSVQEFVKFVISGPESNFLSYVKSKLSPDKYNYLGSTREYDVIQPLCWEACTVIVQKPYPSASTDTAKLRWCTGYGTSDSYWKTYSGYGPIVCFINKNDPTNRDINYQLNIDKNDCSTKYFLNGKDEKPSSDSYASFFQSILSANIDLIPICLNSNIRELRMNPEVKKVAELIKAYKDTSFNYDSEKALFDLHNQPLGKLTKEVNVDIDIVEKEAFSGFTNLRKVTFTSKVKKISAQAFYDCIKLLKLELPEELEEIGSEAFANCVALKGTVRLPNSLRKVGRGAFSNTHIMLSVDKNRDTTIEFSGKDAEWLGRHLRGIDVQESLDIDEDLVEELVNENIPRDLARAYAKAQIAQRGVQGHPDTIHTEISYSDKGRRSRRYDYANSTYTPITEEEAWNIFKNDKEHIDTLRILVAGYLIEYELRGGTRFYQSYWTDELPYELATEIDNRDPRGNITTDSRYITTPGKIKKLLHVADKIYKTDEYDHKITSETPSKHKIKVPRVNPETKEIETDEAGNPLYDIVDDTIQNRRIRNARVQVLRTYVPQGDPDHVVHAAGDNIKRVAGITTEVPDTGAHDIDDLFPSIMFDTDYSTPAHIKQEMNKVRETYKEYTKALKLKKSTFKEYDYSRQALKKVQSNRDLYDEDEYAEIEAELKQDVDEKYKAYLEAAANVRKFKDKLLFNLDSASIAYSERLKTLLTAIQEYLNKLYQLGQELTKLKALKLSELPADDKLEELEEQKEAIQEELNRAKNIVTEMLKKLAGLNVTLNSGNWSDDIYAQLINDENYQRIIEINKQINELSEKQMKQKFDLIDDLEKKIAELEEEIKQKFPFVKIRGKVDKAKRDIDPSIAHLIKFDDETGDSDQA